MILITGANGFVGSKLVSFFNKSKRSISTLSRSKIDLSRISNYFDNKLNPEILKNVFNGVDTIIHCAAKVHTMNKTELDTLANYRLVNVNGTCQLAEKAAMAGVKRFIFLSSLKVSELNNDNQKLFFSPDLEEQIKKSKNPDKVSNDPYTVSKFEAEQELWKISNRTGLEVVIIRLPLIYGPGVKGNFARLVKLMEFNLPLPLANIKNKRSFLGIDNLIDLLVCCVDHPEAKGKTFLASDGDDLSTPDLLRCISSAMGNSARLFFFPVSLLKFFGLIFRRQSEISRLIESMQVDIEYTKKTLNWNPTRGVKKGIRQMLKER